MKDLNPAGVSLCSGNNSGVSICFTHVVFLSQVMVQLGLMVWHVFVKYKNTSNHFKIEHWKEFNLKLTSFNNWHLLIYLFKFLVCDVAGWVKWTRLCETKTESCRHGILNQIIDYNINMKLIFLLKLVTPGSGVSSAELSACFCCPHVAIKITACFRSSSNIWKE